MPLKSLGVSISTRSQQQSGGPRSKKILVELHKHSLVFPRDDTDDDLHGRHGISGRCHQRPRLWDAARKGAVGLHGGRRRRCSLVVDVDGPRAWPQLDAVCILAHCRTAPGRRQLLVVRHTSAQGLLPRLVSDARARSDLPCLARAFALHPVVHWASLTRACTAVRHASLHRCASCGTRRSRTASMR